MKNVIMVVVVVKVIVTKIPVARFKNVLDPVVVQNWKSGTFPWGSNIFLPYVAD
jgi:hypothetical protein